MVVFRLASLPFEPIPFSPAFSPKSNQLWRNLPFSMVGTHFVFKVPPSLILLICIEGLPEFCGELVVWVWLKIKQEGLRRFWSMFPLTRVPFWVPIFYPQLYIYIYTPSSLLSWSPSAGSS